MNEKKAKFKYIQSNGSSISFCGMLSILSKRVYWRSKHILERKDEIYFKKGTGGTSHVKTQGLLP